MFMKSVGQMFTKDVMVVTLTQLWRLISGPMSMLLIPIFMTADIQGFWYTFGSVCALSAFADLGFTWIIMQFSAHEFAFLKLDRTRGLEGSPESIGGLSSLFRFVLRWTTALVLLVFPVIFIVGIVMFSQKAAYSVWLIPWIIFSVSSSVQFFNSSVSSFTMGCDQVATIQVTTLLTSMLSFLVTWGCLFMHMGLYSLALAQLSGSVAFAFIMAARYKQFFFPMIRYKGAAKKWGKEILTLLWRYALSWSSGYLIFSLYTPLAFQFHGSVDAGKVGITITLVTAMFSLSNSWFNANTPKLAILVAKKDWKALDSSFLKNLIMTLATYILGILTLVIMIAILSGRWPFFDKIKSRFLGPIPLIMLIACWFFQIIVNSMAVYMRVHKEEPMMMASIVTGIIVSVSTFLSAKYLPTSMFFVGFLGSFAVSLPWTVLLFFRKRRVWQSPPEAVVEAV